MLVQFPDGPTLLVDLGSTKGKRITGPDIKTYLQKHTKFKNKGQSIDILVLTHGDRDHYNMVLETITTLDIVVEKIIFGGLEEDYGRLIAALRKQCPKMLTIKPTGQFPAWIHDDGKGSKVGIFGWNTTPSLRSDKAWRKNTGSIVLQVVYAGRSVLLTGDATFDTETKIIADLTAWRQLGRLPVDVLKMGHHGSHRTSNSANWLARTNPIYVFVSADRSGSLGKDGKATGHRHPQYLTLDLLQLYAKRLAKDCGQHNWVSAYDPADYDAFNQKPDLSPNGTGYCAPLTKPAAEWRGWVQNTGSFGIFTTLAKMDEKQPDESAADQGVQYALLIDDKGGIDDKGRIDILTTLDTTASPAPIAPKAS